MSMGMPMSIMEDMCIWSEKPISKKADDAEEESYGWWWKGGSEVAPPLLVALSSSSKRVKNELSIGLMSIGFVSMRWVALSRWMSGNEVGRVGWGGVRRAFVKGDWAGEEDGDGSEGMDVG